MHTIFRCQNSAHYRHHRRCPPQLLFSAQYVDKCVQCVPSGGVHGVCERSYASRCRNLERERVCVWPIKLHLASSSKKTDKDGFSLGHENKQAVKKMDKLHSASSSKNTQTRFVSAQSSKYNHKGASEKKRCFGKKKSDRSRRARWSSCMSRTGLRGKSSVGPK